MLNALILAVVVIVGGILILPRVANAQLWRATITPLASIIGSGFLVLGPILDVSYGGYAPLVMAGLCVVAYLFGSAIRFNIAQIDRGHSRPSFTEQLDKVASVVLAFAFIISVAYYLNLFGAFGVSLTDLNNSQNARLLTTSVFAIILLVGWTRGFSALERMEQITVGIKLAIIAGLLFGLIVYFGEAVHDQTLAFDPAQVSGWGALTLAAGLIVTVQGFETSRYLGNAYSAALRIRSMRLAQLISAVIYIAYIVLLTYALDAGSLTLSETAIIDLTAIVAPVLPLLLVAAALSAQFSAAVADTSGAGGLISEITKGKVSEKSAYGVLVIVGVFLTWTADVFQIISYASRAFAAYYALQAGIAAISAHQTGRTAKSGFFAVLTCVGIAITVFGQAVE
ncbi:hypothetical protein SAMN05444287_1139 [Octadecabacter temperatus]|uniref:Uncharacterized protein n=1 Tax=Octadecabacter temperatus TaxID=1458307 RepID=A0A0K0Y4Z6_9RHOB|nr:hypothetical protein [Octadecabacter temperatus]AKS46034.1 hypothetical protein OSB_14820 [Octadecabacter temperatus]SIO06118.1 hypothetical protein SAMN05444287_1139 [Octadecabacter temperatus]